ncbi:MAG: hypothetical protein GY861_18705, partial [bacterium]|nr:hypothetical protein [bacterium]
KEDKDTTIDAAMARRILSSMTRQELVTFGITGRDLIGTTIEEAVNLIADKGKIDVRFVAARSLIESSRRIKMGLNIKAISRMAEFGVQDEIVMEALLDWLQRAREAAEVYPELNLPKQKIRGTLFRAKRENAKSSGILKETKRIGIIMEEEINAYFTYNPIEYSTLPLLQRLLSYTKTGQYIKRKGIVFVDDLVNIGGLVIPAKVIHQAFSSQAPFTFVPFHDCSRFPPDAFAEVSSWAQVPEDWQDLEPIIFHQEVAVNKLKEINFDGEEHRLQRLSIADSSHSDYRQYLLLIRKVAEMIMPYGKASVSEELIGEIVRWLVDVKIKGSFEFPETVHQDRPEAIVTNLLVYEYCRPNIASLEDARSYMLFIEKLARLVLNGGVEIPQKLIGLRKLFRPCEEIEVIRFWRAEWKKAQDEFVKGAIRLTSGKIIFHLQLALARVATFRNRSSCNYNITNQIRELAGRYAKTFNILQVEGTSEVFSNRHSNDLRFKAVDSGYNGYSLERSERRLDKHLIRDRKECCVPTLLESQLIEPAIDKAVNFLEAEGRIKSTKQLPHVVVVATKKVHFGAYYQDRTSILYIERPILYESKYDLPSVFVHELNRGTHHQNQEAEARYRVQTPVVRVFENIDERLESSFIQLQIAFRLSADQADAFRSTALSTFPNRERSIRYIDYLIRDKLKFPDRSLAKIIKETAGKLYITSQELPLYLISLFRLYNGQKLVVASRNSAIVSALEALRQSKAGGLVEEKFEISLPKTEEITHVKFDRFASIAIAINSILSKEDKDTTIDAAMARRILSSMTRQELVTFGITGRDLIGTTIEEAVNL